MLELLNRLILGEPSQPSTPHHDRLSFRRILIVCKVLHKLASGNFVMKASILMACPLLSKHTLTRSITFLNQMTA